MDPASGTLQKLAINPRKKAVGLLRAGNTYEAARLGEEPCLRSCLPLVDYGACASRAVHSRSNSLQRTGFETEELLRFPRDETEYLFSD